MLSLIFGVNRLITVALRRDRIPVGSFFGLDAQRETNVLSVIEED